MSCTRVISRPFHIPSGGLELILIVSNCSVGLTTMVGMWIFIGLLGLAAMPIGVAGYKQFPLPLWVSIAHRPSFLRSFELLT